MPKGVKYGGRKKGTPNRITGEVREMILQALNNKGGAAYFEKVAGESPAAFCTLVGKIIPKEHSVDASINDPIAELLAHVAQHGKRINDKT